MHAEHRTCDCSTVRRADFTGSDIETSVFGLRDLFYMEVTSFPFPPSFGGIHRSTRLQVQYDLIFSKHFFTHLLSGY